MSGRFWFGPRVPLAFSDPIVTPHLSFNGQLHFHCTRCDQYTWADIVFGKELLKSGAGFPCPNCRSQRLRPHKFSAVNTWTCANCGIETHGELGEEFRCPKCSDTRWRASTTTIKPEYPSSLNVLYSRTEPFGLSAGKDAEFIAEYVRSLRMSPEFHLNCVYLIKFVESLFEDLYRSNPDASDLLNAASGLMRTVFRETADPDAGYLAITAMLRGREVTKSRVERAVYGFNICQNIYSVLARGVAPILEVRFGRPLKSVGVSTARQTLAEFDAIGETYLFEIRAKLKWLLGDILKAESPSEAEIDEALSWFNAALADNSLPEDVKDYVRESALTAQSKRRTLSAEARASVGAELGRIASSSLEGSTGLQRIQTLCQILQRLLHEPVSKGERQALSMRCLGEALIYIAANDPKTMLRHAGTNVSVLVSAYAAERIDAGAAFDAVAGVEAFRSLAISHAEGEHVRREKFELSLHFQRLLGTGLDPATVAEEMLIEHRELLARDLHALFAAEPLLLILWVEINAGSLTAAKLSKVDGAIQIELIAGAADLDQLRCAMSLPFPDAPPGRMRAYRIRRSLLAGWSEMKQWLAAEPPSRPCLFIGPSMLGSWPIDAAEAVALGESAPLRPVAFSPAIRVAAAGGVPARPLTAWRVLLIAYGGSDLPGTVQEVNGLQALYGQRCTTISGSELTKNAVLSALRNEYEVIHFCGHGDFDFLDPMASRLYLYDSDGEGGYLTAEDIRSCGTVGRSPIVVLSACTSAMVLPNGSNNYLGLAGALISCGARAIVGARWPICDETGYVFSMNFHRCLTSGMSVAAAAARAKDALTEAGLDEWSAFMSIQG